MLCAAEHGKTEVVQVLLNSGANVNKLASDGTSALMLAISSGVVAIVKLLLKANADTKSQSKVDIQMLYC